MASERPRFQAGDIVRQQVMVKGLSCSRDLEVVNPDGPGRHMMTRSLKDRRIYIPVPPEDCTLIREAATTAPNNE